MNYHRIITKFTSGVTNFFSIDWHCYPDQIMMEGSAKVEWKGHEYTSGFDRQISVPDGLYDLISSYGLDICNEQLEGDNGDRFSVRIWTDTYFKSITGSSLNIPTEQIIMKMVTLSPEAFQAVAWRVFGLNDEDLHRFPLKEKDTRIFDIYSI